jgi:hypothetical protein
VVNAKEDAMRKLAIGITAAATLLTAVPAFAQIEGRVGVGDLGVGVRVGPTHEGYRAYGWDRGRVRDDCRRITVRERLPDGSVIVRTRSRC